ncbi:MAG: DUF2116 family Zn-ribbon domain-containing protein [Candidatus Thermoplasmatota archaeon]|nr:DUF2116 family Zn-ribbon domain-containing protein [Candidatus Thermoplasmatota archaeon]
MTDDVDIVVQHLHCPICGKAIPPEEEFCSDVCNEKMKAIVKKRKLYTYVIYGLMLLVLLVMMLNMGTTPVAP